MKRMLITLRHCGGAGVVPIRHSGRILLALAALALAGCATKPLMVSCLSKEQLAELKAQEPPRVKDRLTGRADEDVRLIAGSNLRLRSWGGTLMGVLEVCAK